VQAAGGADSKLPPHIFVCRGVGVVGPVVVWPVGLPVRSSTPTTSVLLFVAAKF
jgi:hypothetical protein